jgi:hypothetical protein
MRQHLHWINKLKVGVQIFGVQAGWEIWVMSKWIDYIRIGREVALNSKLDALIVLEDIFDASGDWSPAACRIKHYETIADMRRMPTE